MNASFLFLSKGLMVNLSLGVGMRELTSGSVAMRSKYVATVTVCQIPSPLTRGGGDFGLLNSLTG